MNDKDLDLNLGISDGTSEKEVPETKTVKTNKTTKKDVLQESINKTDEALKNAAATAAVKAAVEANNEIATREAEKTYIIEKKKFMLNKCKTDDVVEITGQKIYAQYFGQTYTFLYNGIPVTIKFDGTKQKFPKFVAEMILQKINDVSEANTPKVDIDDRTE